MPVYEVTSPDGKTWEVNAPEGATQDQVLSYAQAQWKPAAKEPEPTAAPMSRMDRFTKGLRDPIDGGAQLLTKMLPDSLVQAGNRLNNMLADKTGLVGRLPEGGVDQQVREGEQAYQAQRAASGETGIDGYRLLGNVASPVNAGLGSAARLLPAASLGARVGGGIATGAASGALAPVEDGDFAQQKLKQIAAGGAVGGVAPAVIGGVSRVISPNASKNAELELLKQAGVKPTVGQSLGGWANRAEEKAASLPLVGDAIASARGGALEQFNKAAIDRAVAPIGKSVNATGQDGVREAGNLLSQAYDDAISQIKVIRFDNQFGQDLTQLKGMAQSLVPSMRAKFNKQLDDVVAGRMSGTGSMLGQTYKKVDSELGQLASRYKGSQVASEAELGDAFAQLQSLLRQQAMRSNPKAAEGLKAADEGWANLVRVEGAAKTAKNSNGLFTPGQLTTAIQTADKSARKRAVSRGEALMQDLGAAGQNVLGNKVPNSGTADRLMLGGASLGGAYFLDPVAAAGLIGGAGLYTGLGQGLLRGAVSSRPGFAEPVADALRQSSPALLPGLAQIGPGLLNY